MNKIIEVALKNQKEAYNRNIEKVFDIVEIKIISSSKKGMRSTLFTFEDLPTIADYDLRYMLMHNSERFIDDLADHLEIDKSLIKRVHSPKSPNDNLITGIYINWGETNAE